MARHYATTSKPRTSDNRGSSTDSIRGSALAMSCILSSPRRDNEAGQRKAVSKAAWVPHYAARLAEFRTSSASRLSVDSHDPRDRPRIRAAAKRKAEAEAWIASVKARKKR